MIIFVFGLGFLFCHVTLPPKRQRVLFQPTYLYQVKNSKSYFFRIRFNFFEKLCHIPFSSKHFVASLKTSDLHEAMSLSQFIARKLTDEAKIMANKNVMSVSRSTNSSIEAANVLLNIDGDLLRIELHNALKKRFTHWLVVGKRMLQLGVVESTALTNLRTVPKDALNTHYSQSEDVQMHPSPNKHFLGEVIAHAARLGVNLDPRIADAHMMNRLISELKKIGKEYGNYSPALVDESPECSINDAKDFIALLTTLPQFTAYGRRVERASVVTSNKHALLDKCIDDFCISKFCEVGTSAQQQYTKSLETLRDVLGPNFLVTDFSPEHTLKFKNVVLKIPSGRKKKGIQQTLSVKSVNKYLSNASAFCDWLMKTRKLIQTNPFAGSKLKLTSKNQQKRRQFSFTEISSLVAYLPRDKREAANFRKAAAWFSVIGIYSGMRLAEIANLKVVDIKNAEAIWYFDLTTYDGKNDNAPRIIPIHSKQIESGFLDYCQEVKNTKNTMLFSEINTKSKSANRDGAGVEIGKWFNRTLLRNIGINKLDERDIGILVDFHCCRHTVASRFKYHGVDGYIAKQILGHDQEDEITWGTYSNNQGTKLSMLKRVIETLDY
jgi:integrase